MQRKDAFIAGIVKYAKQADMDGEDAVQLARLLLMPVVEARPIIEGARAIKLARCRVEAGEKLRQLTPLIKEAWSWGNAGAGAASGAGWGAMIGNVLPVIGMPIGALVGGGLGGLLGGLFGGGGEAAATPSGEEQWNQYMKARASGGSESPETVYQRLHPTPPAPPYEAVKDVPAVQEAVRGEQARASKMTPQQHRTEALRQGFSPIFGAQAGQMAELQERRGGARLRLANIRRMLGPGESIYDPSTISDPMLRSQVESVRGTLGIRARPTGENYFGRQALGVGGAPAAGSATGGRNVASGSSMGQPGPGDVSMPPPSSASTASAAPASSPPSPVSETPAPGGALDASAEPSGPEDVSPPGRSTPQRVSMSWLQPGPGVYS